MSRQPLSRKAALKVAGKRTTAMLSGLLEGATAALESEWDQTPLDLSD